ncbi:gonadotropin-releasing hormone receptor 2, partial [Aphelenchoides avenae]
MSFQMEKPPEPIASDFVEMATLALLFLIGAPMNLAAYTRISERKVSTRLDILKRHLNYTDLLVIFIYVPSRGCWLVTYDWRGGDFLCRLVKFLHTFTFQVSSNVIVCIALDRLLTVTSPDHHNPELALKRTRRHLYVAWVTALIISAPQFAIWRSYTAFEKLNWSQCMQIWEIMRAEAYFKNNTHFSANVLLYEENIYVVVHMLLIFWLPAAIVLLSYLAVSCWVYLNSKPSLCLAGGRIVADCPRPGVSYHTGAETVDTMVTRATAANPKIVITDDVTRPLTEG